MHIVCHIPYIYSPSTLSLSTSIFSVSPSGNKQHTSSSVFYCTSLVHIMSLSQHFYMVNHRSMLTLIMLDTLSSLSPCLSLLSLSLPLSMHITTMCKTLHNKLAMIETSLIMMLCLYPPSPSVYLSYLCLSLWLCKLTPCASSQSTWDDWNLFSHLHDVVPPPLAQQLFHSSLSFFFISLWK